MKTATFPRRVVKQLLEICDQVRAVVPCGRDATPSYYALLDALRGLDRMIGRNG